MILIRINSTDSRMVEYSSKEGLHPHEITITHDGKQASSVDATDHPFLVLSQTL